MSVSTCTACGGKRLRPEVLGVTVGGKNIIEVTELTISEALEFLTEVRLTEREQLIARQVLKEIKERLSFLVNVGLDYLTLSRASATLSGGESQRIRLATQIGSGLTGVLYVLDEPSIGLHQRDNQRLLDALRSCGIWATPSLWWNTTGRPWRLRTGSSTWAQARAPMAGKWSRPAPGSRSALNPALSQVSISRESGASPA